MIASSNIVERALAHARTQPDRIIVQDRWRTWTWRELETEARRYCAAIRQSHGAAAEPVAAPIVVGRSGAVVAAMLGALLAGRGCAMISAAQPEARLRKCLARLGTTDVLWARHPDEGGTLPDGINAVSLGGSASTDALASYPGANVLYVIFTSGSTGEPKGVMVSHDNLCNTLAWSAHYLDWTDDDAIGSATQFSFDISMFDVFTALVRNVRLVILPDPQDVHDVRRRIAETGISFLFSVPAFFSQFVRAGVLPQLAGTRLRRIISGGDFFPPAHILAWRHAAPQVEVINCWGPTETSVVNTFHTVVAADHPALERGNYPPVGRSHALQPIILLDEAGQEVTEPEARGEIVLLGDSVSMGYLKAPDLTARSYFLQRGKRAYRTGDIGYFDAAGNLYMAGRRDSVVKLAGYRIDLGEVEAALTGVSGIHLAGAFVRDSEHGVPELWAAVELSPGAATPDTFSVKTALRAKVPLYMVPKRIVTMPKLPVNNNGKIDRRAVAAAIEA